MKRRSTESKDEKKSQLNLGFNEIIGGVSAEEPGPEKEATASDAAEFSTFARKEDWQGLAEFSERSILGVSPQQDAEAKLWWITSQFHLLHVPISILAAPLDLLSRDLEEGRLGAEPESGARIRTLVTDLLAAFVPKLKEAGDVRTAEVFQSRLAGLTGREEIRDTPAENMEKASEEKEAVQGRKGLSEAERLRMDLGITHEAPPSLSVVDPAFLDSLAREEESFWKTYFVVGLIVAAFVLGGLWWFLRDQERVALASAAVPVAPQSVASRREMQPKTPEIARIEDVNSLSSLLYTIDEKKPPEPSSAQSRASQSPPPGQQQAQVSPPRPELPRQKERIDTNYPPEPGSSDDTGKSRGRDPLWGDKKRDERSPFGDDDTERGMPVTKFPRAEVFRIITDTLVLPRPSLRSQPIQKLHRGDEVLVEAKVGYWLRLRSQSNRPGFILAQDAEVK